MNLQSKSMCTCCKRDHGDHIQLLWRCPNLHSYWVGVVTKVNSVFKISLPLDLRACLLGVIEKQDWEAHTKEAFHRVLFQAREWIMIHWKSEDPPKIREWVKNVGKVLRMEKLIYQHRGCTLKYERLWALWLDVMGLARPSGSDYGLATWAQCWIKC